MIKIIKQQSEPTLDIDRVSNNMLIGIINNGEKYVVTYTKARVNYSYSRLGKNMYRIVEEYESIKLLLENVVYDEAYKFDTLEELMSWFVSQ